jgi:hypothetical protein
VTSAVRRPAARTAVSSSAAPGLNGSPSRKTCRVSSVNRRAVCCGGTSMSSSRCSSDGGPHVLPDHRLPGRPAQGATVGLGDAFERDRPQAFGVGERAVHVEQDGTQSRRRRGSGQLRVEGARGNGISLIGMGGVPTLVAGRGRALPAAVARASGCPPVAAVSWLYRRGRRTSQLSARSLPPCGLRRRVAT